LRQDLRELARSDMREDLAGLSGVGWGAYSQQIHL
jgi:hypothetical protein